MKHSHFFLVCFVSCVFLICQNGIYAFSGNSSSYVTNGSQSLGTTSNGSTYVLNGTSGPLSGTGNSSSYNYWAGSAHVCGDGVCESSESSSSCPVDCTSGDSSNDDSNGNNRGGGGGGSGASAQPLSATYLQALNAKVPVQVTVTRLLMVLEPNVPLTSLFYEETSPVTQLTIVSPTGGKNVDISITRTQTLPLGMLPPKNRVVDYIVIDHPQFTQDNISRANFVLRIDARKASDPSQLVVQRYTDAWSVVPSVYLETSDGLVYINVTSPGLSVFAVTNNLSANFTNTSSTILSANPRMNTSNASGSSVNQSNVSDDSSDGGLVGNAVVVVSQSANSSNKGSTSVGTIIAITIMCLSLGGLGVLILVKYVMVPKSSSGLVPIQSTQSVISSSSGEASQVLLQQTQQPSSSLSSDPLSLTPAIEPVVVMAPKVLSDPQIAAFIRQNVAKGYDTDTLRHLLLQHGKDPEIIDAEIKLFEDEPF